MHLVCAGHVVIGGGRDDAAGAGAAAINSHKFADGELLLVHVI
jgi:hypothetical protein